MENAFLNGSLLSALIVSKNTPLEEEIRKASRQHQLFCFDEDCPAPVVKYNHGDKKTAYFSHVQDCGCSYARFDKQNTDGTRQIEHILYNQFQNKGFAIKMDVKITPSEYVHLAISSGGKLQLAIRLVSKISIFKIHDLQKAEKEANVPIKLIEVSTNVNPVEEKEAGLIKRAQIYRGAKSIIVISPNGQNATQYAIDPNKYEYRGRSFQPKGFSKFFSEKRTCSELTLENGEVTFEGFFARFESFLQDKRKAFLEEVSKIDFIKPADIYHSSINSTLPRGWGDLPLAKCSDKEIFTCVRCGHKGPKSEFWTYGGEYGALFGKCNKC